MFAFLTEPAKVDMVPRTEAEADTESTQICRRMNRMGILGGTKGSEPRPKIGGQNHTDMTMDVVNRTNLSNKR